MNEIWIESFLLCLVMIPSKPMWWFLDYCLYPMLRYWLAYVQWLLKQLSESLVVSIGYLSQWWGHWLRSAVWPLYRVLTSWCRIVWNWPGYWPLNCLFCMCKIWCYWDKNLLVYVSLDCFPEINFLLDLWLWIIFLYVYVLLFRFLIFRVLLNWKLPER